MDALDAACQLHTRAVLDIMHDPTCMHDAIVGNVGRESAWACGGPISTGQCFSCLFGIGLKVNLNVSGETRLASTISFLLSQKRRR